MLTDVLRDLAATVARLEEEAIQQIIDEHGLPLPAAVGLWTWTTVEGNKVGVTVAARLVNGASGELILHHEPPPDFDVGGY